MKQSVSISTTVLSVIIAIGSLSFARKASNQKKAAEQEAKSLRLQVAELSHHPQHTPEPTNLPTNAVQESIEDTNAIVVLQEALPEPEAERQDERPRRESFEERMAQMKEEDPERYAEMIQRREERQQTLKYNLAERTATFMDLDTTHMTEEERKNHELLVNKMANIWALTDQFQDPEQAPDREAMGALFSEIREARPLMEMERSTMFKQLGTDLGYEGAEAQDFANHVEDIISATTLQMPRGGGRGGRGGGGR